MDDSLKQSNIEYRKATIDDCNYLAKIRTEFLAEVNHIVEEAERDVLYQNNKEYFLKSMKEETFIAWIAVDGIKIIATSGIAFYTLPPNKSCPNGKVAYISNMFTSREYRKQGIAAKLFDLIVDEGKKLGCSKIMLNATDMGRPIYEKYGFVNIENEMVYYIK